VKRGISSSQASLLQKIDFSLALEMTRKETKQTGAHKQELSTKKSISHKKKAKSMKGKVHKKDRSRVVFLA
jgi:hypothetical protein